MKKPVLFLIFNRPEYSQEVFNAIRLYKPDRLYVAADGPRSNIQNELILCEQTRSVLQLIDWPCDVKTLFRDSNLGCKIAVSSAIDWFFDNELDGIILEDDVVPNSDFFDFCEYNLEKYKNDNRIMMISGSNHYSDQIHDSSYFFSKQFSIWGWATWRRAWNLYDVNMTMWEDRNTKKDIKYMFNGNYIWKHFENTFDSLYTTYLDTWDIQWVFACVVNNGLCITPKVNLITNIGLIGTHSNILTDSHFLDKYELGSSINYKDPKCFIVNSAYDEKFHILKNKPANRRYLAIKLLRKFHLYNTLRFFIRFFRKTVERI
jgi:hypothetical protein